jgi:hypothetical protein
MLPALPLAMVTKLVGRITIRRYASPRWRVTPSAPTRPTGSIDIVRAWVAAIAGHGTLTGEKLDAVIAAGVAERSIKLERARREDWRRREQSALTFLTDGFPARQFDRIEKPLIP